MDSVVMTTIFDVETLLYLTNVGHFDEIPFGQ